MENLTHTLLGATLAEAALPTTASPAQRRVFYVAGIVAANLPDADLLYTSIMQSPLGYLLHHRGHTHTVVGLIGLGVVCAIVNAIPAIRRHTMPVAGRFWILVCAALASHLIADAWNSYGVHPFYPLENQWFYGDVVNIVEPWLWTLLGVASVMNARSARVRFLLASFLITVSVAAALVGLIRGFVLVPMTAVAALLVWTLRTRQPPTRAIVALGAVLVFVVISFGAKVVARREALSSISPAGGATVIDLVLTPKAANLLCWNALAIQQQGEELVMQRAEIPVGFGGWRIAACAKGQIDWFLVARQSIAELRSALDDCRVKAWLQFGRAPLIQGGMIADVRFGDASGRNFTAMPIASVHSGRECPPHITAWGYPRADVLFSHARPRE